MRVITRDQFLQEARERFGDEGIDESSSNDHTN